MDQRARITQIHDIILAERAAWVTFAVVQNNMRRLKQIEDKQECNLLRATVETHQYTCV